MKITDVVDRINGNVDRFTTELEYYIGGEHFESNELEVTQKGLLKENLGKLGFKFHFAFQDRDVVFMARNPHLRKAGMVRFAGLCSDASYILRSKDETVLSQEYLAVMLQSDHFWDYCESHKVGSVNFANNWSSIANYEFELPTPEEQKEISDKVWAAYRLKKSYKKLLAATEEMVKSQFIEMFGTLDEPKVEVKKLIDVVLSSGQYGSNTSATDYQEGKPRYIRITDINDDGSLNDDIKTAEVIEDKYKLIPGDIVFARTGATVGKTYMHETGNAIYAGYLIKYQMDESKMKPAFMKAFTHSKTYYNWVANSQKIGAQPNISAAQYDKMPVLVPQIEKQEDFLTIYQQADKSGFDGFKSQFIEMFGDPMVNDKQWSEYSCISEITQIVLGGTPNSKEPSYWDGDIRWITPAEMTDQSYYIFDTVRHITDEGRKVANLTVLPEGTVLFSTRAPIGKVAIVGKEMCCNQGFKNFICSEKLNNVFLYYTLKLKKDYLCSLGTGTTFKELSKRTVESLKIAVPPIELQNQFETIYNQADKSGSVLQYRIAC